MTRRGRRVLAVLGALAAAGAAFVGYLVLTGKEVPGVGAIGGKEPPPVCPLTGEVAKHPEAVERPALAIKVENISSARPQSGLNHADIVYEEPVEGGITRFIAIYQCISSKRIGPVRSARLVDADVLRQYGTPLFAFAGGVRQVVRAARQAGVVDVNFLVAPKAYEEDPDRSAPHNLFVSTASLYEAGKGEGEPPDPVFRYAAALASGQASKPVKKIRLDFSPEADVTWRFAPKRRVWIRYHDDARHQLESGRAVNADTVVVQIVKVRPGAIIDAAGNPSPEIDVIGDGKAYVFRGGRVIQGTWVRDGEDDLTKLLDASGDEIPLVPGRTWVELFPKDRPFRFK